VYSCIASSIRRRKLALHVCGDRIQRVEVVRGDLVVFDGDSVAVLQELDELQHARAVDDATLHERFVGLDRLIGQTDEHRAADVVPDFVDEIELLELLAHKAHSTWLDV
jgi:hypothetical protein